MESFGGAMRDAIRERPVTPFIGVHDVVSAAIAARHFDALFVSGFSFAASFYGLPDIGFNTWSDLAAFVGRLRAVLPSTHLLVDIDDGFGDAAIAARVAREMERVGASGVVLEDQRRPRRCGHVGGKDVLPADEFVAKLEAVLAARSAMVVVARTDAATDDERLRRVERFERAGADAVLADGIDDLAVLARIAQRVSCPVMFNQIAGGRSPACSLEDLRALGVSMVNYSTPTLFAAGEAVERAMSALRECGGRLPDPGRDGAWTVATCQALLAANLAASSRPSG